MAGASGAAFGSPVQGIGNAAYFGDAYGPGQYLTDIVAGGVLGGVAGGVAGWLKNVKNVRNGGQPGDIWGFRFGKPGGTGGLGEGTFAEFPSGNVRDGSGKLIKAANDGIEYLDEGLRMTEQPFAGGAKGGQFSTRIIDDAVEYAMKNKVNHVFGKAAHNLDPLVAKLGGQENTFRAVLNAANGKLPASGVFTNIPINVGGYNVIIRGSVINGVPKIGTMFIP